MILDKQEILDYLREIKPELEVQDITNLGLFGSYARDEATENSDIDICCIISKEYKEKYPHLGYLLELKKLRKKISERLHGKKVDLVNILAMNEFMLKAVEQSVIYIDNPMSENDKPRIPDDIFIVENILQEFDQLESLYYNKDGMIYPYYNQENPFYNNFLISKAAQSYIDTSLRRVLRLIRHNSFTVKELTETECKEVQEMREALSPKQITFDENKATKCIKELIPVLKAKLEAALTQYNEEQEDTHSSPSF